MDIDKVYQIQDQLQQEYNWYYTFSGFFPIQDIKVEVMNARINNTANKNQIKQLNSKYQTSYDIAALLKIMMPLISWYYPELLIWIEPFLK
jgi:hypothetical protein